MNTEIKFRGASPAFLLGLTFTILKLCGVIGWSWWWVTCPFWIGAVLVLAIIGVPLLIIGFFALFTACFVRKNVRKSRWE